jgi:hypothetical protein
MTLVVTTDYAINKTAAPNLPLAPGDYNSQYQEQLNNVLRLYFNRLDSLFGQLSTSDFPGASAGGVIWENSTVITSNYTLTAGKNGFSVGPITFASGASVTIPSGQSWVIL